MRENPSAFCANQSERNSRHELMSPLLRANHTDKLHRFRINPEKKMLIAIFVQTMIYLAFTSEAI